MSKRKNKNTGKSINLPVKVQPMKPQKPLVNKNVNKGKLIQSISNKDSAKKKNIELSKPQNVGKKEQANIKSKIIKDEVKKVNEKKIEILDIVSSSEDEDEFDNDVEVLESESESEDPEVSDDEDDDDNNKSTDSSIVGVEESDNEKHEIKERQIENKQKLTKTEINIDKTTESGKILYEINKRKNILNDCVVYVTRLPKTFSRQKVLDIFNEVVPVINVNLPSKMKRKKFLNRGYAFIRFANLEDSTKAIKVFNSKDIDGVKILASKFICKKVYNVYENVDFKKIAVYSFENEDITDLLKECFKAPVVVTKMLKTQYVLQFPNESDAMNLFKKEKMTLKGKELIFNFIYSQKKDDSKIIKTSEPVSVKPQPGVKVAVKRDASNSDMDEAPLNKKLKLSNGNKSPIKKGDVPKSTVKQNLPIDKKIVKTNENKPSEKKSLKTEIKVLDKKIVKIDTKKKSVDKIIKSPPKKEVKNKIVEKVQVKNKSPITKKVIANKKNKK